jgi:hypothetical protein
MTVIYAYVCIMNKLSFIKLIYSRFKGDTCDTLSINVICEV